MSYTREEKQEIKKSLGLVLDDIRELWKISQPERISIKLGALMPDYSDFRLEIGKYRVALAKHYIDETTRIYFERPGISKPNRTPSDYEAAMSFIANYEEIRKEIEKEIKNKIGDKEWFHQKLEEINMKYDKHADIVIDAPPTNNIQELEVVTDENGRKILTLDFGERIINIVTNGGFRLVDKSQKSTQHEQTEIKPDEIKRKKL